MHSEPCQCCIDREAKGSQVTNFFCLECCAEMVRRLRPVRALQEKELEAIAYLKGTPSREKILAKLKEMK